MGDKLVSDAQECPRPSGCPMEWKVIKRSWSFMEMAVIYMVKEIHLFLFLQLEVKVLNTMLCPDSQRKHGMHLSRTRGQLVWSTVPLEKYC